MPRRRCRASRTPVHPQGGPDSSRGGLDLVSRVVATSKPPRGVEPEHMQVLGLRRGPISVAKVSAHRRHPVAVTKVLLVDLIECNAVATRAPPPMSGVPDRDLLEKPVNGLQRL